MHLLLLPLYLKKDMQELVILKVFPDYLHHLLLLLEQLDGNLNLYQYKCWIRIPRRHHPLRVLTGLDLYFLHLRPQLNNLSSLAAVQTRSKIY
jgi:hypothetical protein